MKKLDYILLKSFIRKIFDELKQTKKKTGIRDISKSTNFEFVSSKKFLDEINYVKPPESYKIFTKTYINIVKSKLSYEDLKKFLEKFDQGSSGTMTKLEYVTSMSKLFPEFNDDDHMRFIRIMELLDKNNKVIYQELLNIIFYANINKKNGKFTIICEFLLEKLKNECQNDVQKLMYLFEDNPKRKITSLKQHEPLSIEQFQNFLKKENLNIDKKVLLKLDIDSDGLISYNDLYAVFLRYKDTLYFKYYNNSIDANINLFTKDFLSKDKIRIIAKKTFSLYEKYKYNSIWIIQKIR